MRPRTSFRVLVPVLVFAALGACGKAGAKRDPGRAGVDEDATAEANDPDRDSANLRAAGMRQWFTESKTAGHPVWSRDYRAYLLDAARAERLRWPELMPGATTHDLIGGSQWKSLGPTKANSGPNGSGNPVSDSGRITAIIPDGARLFVATAGGGVWRRDNGVWTPLTETVGTLSTGALAMDPSNHDRLYLGLGDSFDGTGVGVLISTDGGNSWSDPIFLGDSMIIPQIVVDPATTSIVLAATDKGLYRSTNSGVSFDPVTIPTTGLLTGPYIWSIASTGGHNFVLSLGQIPVDKSITTDGQTWFSSNDGATWTKSTGLTATSGIGRVTVASAPSAPQTVYALAGLPNADSTSDLADIFKSTDGGQSWTALGVASKSYTNGGGKLKTLLNQQGWYNQLVLVDPSNANTAYFGGALLLAKTTDGGTTFRAMTDWLGATRPYVHADFHAGAIDASGLYVGTDGGLFQSTDAGTTFSNALNVGLVTHLLYSVGSSPAAPDEVIGGMQDNGTRVREGATTTFDEVIGGDGFGAAINRTNGQLMIGSLYYDGIQVSSDGGNNWNDGTSGLVEANDQNNAPFITTIVPWEGPASTGNEVYTFSNTKVYKSTNFASSWTALPTPPPLATAAIIRNVGVAPSDAKIIGVLASGGGVYFSKDGGSTWTQIANGKGADPTALPNSDRSMSSVQFDPSNPNTVYIASVAPEASVNHLWKSTDFGAHWASIDGNGLPAGVPINVIKADPIPAAGMPDKVLYAGTHLGVYRTTDGGATWSRFGGGMPLVSVTDLYVSPDEKLVRAATFGRGFWELTTPDNDFSMTANPTSVTVAQGASGTTNLTTAVTAGAAQSVAFTVSGLPTGASASFTPSSVTSGGGSVLKLTAGAATLGGTYTLTITGTGTSATHSITISFTVTATDDFSITADPAAVTIAPGASGTSTITTAVIAGAAQDVALSVSGVPTGVTAALAPTTVTAGATSTLTLTADGTAAPGTYPLTVKGTSASAIHTASLSLTIGAAGDFTISVAPDALTLAPGASGTTTITIGGTAQTIDLSVDGATADVTAMFDKTVVTTGATATLTISTSALAAAGATLTITGTGASATHTATVTVTLDTSGGGPMANGSGKGGCGCASTGTLGETSGNLALALAVLGFGFRRPRRRRIANDLAR